MLIETAFIVITCVVLLLFYLGWAGQGRVLVIYLAWCAGIAILAYTGFFKITQSLPPRILLVIIPAIIFVVCAYKQANVSRIKVPFLLAVHTLRLPVELVLYQLFLQGLVPEGMTFGGWNFDVFSGLSAMVLLVLPALKIKLPDRLWICWNVLGLILLATVVLTAIFSAPSPVQLLAYDQPNRAILYFPYTLLPALVVPLVLLSHLLLLKKMFQ